MKASRTAAGLVGTLFLASQALAGPSMRLGASVRITGDRISFSISDSLGEVVRVTERDPHRGLELEALYGPVWWLYGRVELAEVQLFNAGGGGVSAFPATGLDVLVEPPFHWRVLPYIWGGMRWTGWWGSQGTPDPRFYGTPYYDARAGLGVRYELNRRWQVYGETQMVSDLTTLEYTPFRDFPNGYWRFTSIGFARVDLGVRYNLGAK